MIRPYSADDHKEVMQWLHARSKEVTYIAPECFPMTGFIVPGLAACFLYKTDSSVAYIDLLISNPEGPKDKSRAALDEVVLACIDQAKKDGFKILTATTKHRSVVERGQKHNFKMLPGYYHLFLKL